MKADEITGGDITKADEITGGAVVAQKSQSLQIGNGVIQPVAVQRAIDLKAAVTQFQALADSQHGIGIVFFYGEHLRAFRGVAQGIKVADDAVGGQTQLLQVAKSAVSGQKIIRSVNGAGEFFKTAGTENNTSIHMRFLLGVFLILAQISATVNDRLSHQLVGAGALDSPKELQEAGRRGRRPLRR